MKLALALIVKGSDEEAVFLDRCLATMYPYVDGIFITSTHKKGEEPNNKVSIVAAKYKANVSYFQWQNDFAKARNFNFSKVPKEYDYIMWLDADDSVQNPDKIRPTIEENKVVDAFAFWYYYAFDEHNNPTIVHKKTQIVRNDGCVEWIGRLHEDFKENRGINAKFIEGIQRIHLSTPEHFESAKERNVEISKEEAKLNPQDPKVYFNLANSLLGAGRVKEAKKEYLKFLKDSQSEQERYIVRQNLSAVEKQLGNRDEAIEHLQIAIGMYPDLPDAYNQLGYLYFDYELFDQAERYLLIGLVMKPKYHEMIVYNPRDYDYNPMMALAKVYFNKSRPDYALPLLEGCASIYPEDKIIQSWIEEMQKEKTRLENVLVVIKELDGVTDKNLIKSKIDSLDNDMKSHPAVRRIINEHFIKTESTGKDIAYFCGETTHEWNPDLFKTKGFGGSEEAVINLSKEWAKQGYNITVFNSCGMTEMVRDGVTYKPFWTFNAKDKYDHLIIWRHPKMVDHDINATNIYIDLHDVISEGEFTEKRLKKINKIFVKTKFHRSLFPKIDDSKFAIIPNGLDTAMFENQNIERDPYLLINTSSPDRSMDVLPKLFKMIKERVPQAKLKWAYGWETFDASFKNDKKMMEWRHQIQKDCDEAGIISLGKIPQAECAKLYLEGSIFAYPSEFAEIDCISVKKAQVSGCVPVTTDFGALDESNIYGFKIHSDKTKDNWNRAYQWHFGLEDEKKQLEWVETVVNQLQNPIEEKGRANMGASINKTFNWERISRWWIDETANPLKRELQTNE